MTTYTYVDNSNLYIEGSRVSAVKKGRAKNIAEAMRNGIVDRGWMLDYGKLYKYVSGEDTVAKLWGPPPPGDSFWKMVDNAGFKTHVYNKNAGNKEKKVDVAIATVMMDDAFNIIDKDNDDILLVASSEADERAAPDMSATGAQKRKPALLCSSLRVFKKYDTAVDSF